MTFKIWGDCMKVKQLMNKLETMPQDAEIAIEMLPTYPLPWDYDSKISVAVDMVYESADGKVWIQCWD